MANAAYQFGSMLLYPFDGLLVCGIEGPHKKLPAHILENWSNQ